MHLCSLQSSLMEGFHLAGTGKNKKVIEISPLLAFWHERAKEWKFKKIISLVKNGLFQILFMLSVPKIVPGVLLSCSAYAFDE